MLEIPEAAVLAEQLNAAVRAKTIRRVIAGQHPHGFAWYSGDPQDYPARLEGKPIGTALSRGGMVEIEVEDVILLFSDGVNLRLHDSAAAAPAKHQLLLEFGDDSALSAVVAMYGGLYCWAPEGLDANPYYAAAKSKPSPLGDGFSAAYFASLFQPELEKLALKAFLATEQRIPGLGNGVLQDILYQARLHPKRKVATLSADDRDTLYAAIKTTLAEMTAGGGRDTEKDLFDQPGGYATRMSKNTVGKPCPRCGSLVEKQSFMGGSIYFCPGCQPAP